MPMGASGYFAENYRYDSSDRPVIKYYNNDSPGNAGYHTVYNANGLVGLHKEK